MNWHATGIDIVGLAIVSILDFLGKIIHKKTVANLIPVIITPVAVSLASHKDCGVFWAQMVASEQNKLFPKNIKVFD